MNNTNQSNNKPPMFPQELLDRPIPAGIMKRGDRPLDGMGVAMQIHDYQLAALELARGLQQHIAEAIGLIDAGRTAHARTSLDRAVQLLDSIDYAPLIERGAIEG